jgi:Transglutaminase-like superfamily
MCGCVGVDARRVRNRCCAGRIAPVAKHPLSIGGQYQHIEATSECRSRCGYQRGHDIGVPDRSSPTAGAELSESLLFALNGEPIEALEVSGLHGNRIHKFQAPAGNLHVSYTATIVGKTDPAPVTEYDLTMYLSPSRYAEADKFYGFAATEFGDYADSTTLLENVSLWVGTRLIYVPGSSDPIDGAVDTLLAGNGVCRDYAHLVLALLRAVNVPVRLVAVYAPGLSPMDSHAVAEAFIDGAWRVVDATCLAPRQALVRIATGCDAADTAFLDNHKGAINLNNMTVTATSDDDLPKDSVDQLVSIQ